MLFSHSVLYFSLLLKLSMMEDPTAPSSGFDGDVELEEEREMRRLVYLLRVPNELAGPEEMKNTVKFLIQWAKVFCCVVIAW